MTEASATFTQGSIARHIAVTASTSAVSLFAVFLVDILTLVYVSMLHDPVLLAAIGIAKVLMFFNSALATGLIIAATAVLSERIGHHAAGSIPRLTASLLIMVFAVCGLSAAVQAIIGRANHPLARSRSGHLRSGAQLHLADAAVHRDSSRHADGRTNSQDLRR